MVRAQFKPRRWTVIATAVSALVVSFLGYSIGWGLAALGACENAGDPACDPTPSVAAAVGWGVAWLAVGVALPTWIQWRHVERAERAERAKSD